jgi:hypothetical protein
VVVKHRELFFWAPAALADSKAMARSVQSGLRRVRERHRRAVAPPPRRPEREEPVRPVVAPKTGGVVGFLKRLIGK